MWLVQTDWMTQCFATLITWSRHSPPLPAFCSRIFPQQSSDTYLINGKLSYSNMLRSWTHCYTLYIWTQHNAHEVACSFGTSISQWWVMVEGTEWRGGSFSDGQFSWWQTMKTQVNMLNIPFRELLHNEVKYRNIAHCLRKTWNTLTWHTHSGKLGSILQYITHVVSSVLSQVRTISSKYQLI